MKLTLKQTLDTIEKVLAANTALSDLVGEVGLEFQPERLSLIEKLDAICEDAERRFSENNVKTIRALLTRVPGYVHLATLSHSLEARMAQ